MLRHLDDAGIRDAMLAEFEEDVANGNLYLSAFQSEAGKAAWPATLRNALEAHDVEWLISSVSNPGFWNATHTRRTPSGGWTEAKVPVSAPITLAAGEFLRFYARAMCRVALESGRGVTVARVRDVERPRTESTAKIGTQVDPRQLLEDLRKNIGIDTSLGVPAGPNSGLGVEFS